MSSVAASSASSAAPSNANEGCVGPSSASAGKVDGCKGCPNQRLCASGAARQPDPAVAKVDDRMASINHVILVLSGKGGVGKSTVSAQLAFGLSARGLAVGLLDVDITGPSLPQMMGLKGQEVHQSASGWSPVYVTHDLEGENGGSNGYNHNGDMDGDMEEEGEEDDGEQRSAMAAENSLGVMSVGFLLPGEDEPVMWRGPRKNGLIKQFLTDVDWGELDVLVIDTPPGTSDEHLSLARYLRSTLQRGKGNGAVVVTTPQEVAMADVRKELNFAVKAGIPVLGLIENMSTMEVSLRTALSKSENESEREKEKEKETDEKEKEKEKDSASVSSSSSSSFLTFVDREGRDCTSKAFAAIQSKCPELLDMYLRMDVFPQGGEMRGGLNAENMAKKFKVPFLGKVPLDPDVSRAGEGGRSLALHLEKGKEKEEGEGKEKRKEKENGNGKILNGSLRTINRIVDRLMDEMKI